jgi:hypothetical protein
MTMTKEGFIDFLKKYKIAIGFGLPMTIFFSIRGFYLLDEYSFNSISRILVSSIAAGALSGFMYHFIMNLFKHSKFVKKSTAISLNENEFILLEKDANHFKGLEAVGGRIYLTNNRIIFKSHSLNIQSHMVSFLWTEINHTARYKTLGLINNGIELHLKNNTIKKFVVEDAETVLVAINKQLVV